MEALFRYIYDLSYFDLYDYNNTHSKLQFLAKLHVAGRKYLVKGLDRDVAMYMNSNLWYHCTFYFSSPPDPDT